jgi:hypothetical protein
MIGRVAEINTAFDVDLLAKEIAVLYDRWYYARQGWLAEAQERRNYIFATDTSTTSNSSLPWKNKTHTPKLAQIRDNLHANYMAAIFANDNWLSWEGGSKEAEKTNKKKAALAYAKQKIDTVDFRNTISKLVYDYIDYGNAIADVKWIDERKVDPVTNDEIVVFRGPKVVRTPIESIVFNILADEFDATPKITRTLMSCGDLELKMQTCPEEKYDEAAYEAYKANRTRLGAFRSDDIDRAIGVKIDGFGSFSDYLSSGFVEILEIEGTIADSNGVLHDNKIITVIDRSVVLREIDNPTLFGRSTKKHVGWRLRQDNLMAMGPLDNLVGLQYRIDHLENLKADAMDLSIFPPLKIRGEVEDFEYSPLAEIFLGEDGDVAPMAPNPSVFGVDNEIAYLENKMEEMAGAPRAAMGHRTPGEKTAFEVQQLSTAATRIFQEKINNFEMNFLEPLINGMLELARRRLDTHDIIRTLQEDEMTVVKFLEIDRDDLSIEGKLKPIGARHFTAQSTLVQNLMGWYSSGIMQDPDVKVHTSAFGLAKLMQENTGLEKFGLVKKNIRILEQKQTQALANQAQQDLEVEGSMPVSELELDEELINAGLDPNQPASLEEGEGPTG